MKTEARSGQLYIALDGILNLEELRRIRSELRGSSEARFVRIDFGAVRSIEPDAARLLARDLVDRERRGVRIEFAYLPRRLRRELREHPLGRFVAEDDELFTDPFLEHTGFRPSRH